MLTVGHCGIPTGFARVLRKICLALCDSFELHHFAINHQRDGQPTDWPCPIIHNLCGDDLHNPSALYAVLESVRPDLVLILDEPWACARLMPAFVRYPQVRTVLYLAIHGHESLPQPVVAELAKADHLVAFTARAERLLCKALQSAAEEPRVSTIPHGVDTQVFRPLVKTSHNIPAASRIRHARELIFPDKPDLADAFIVLNANRNQPYKGIDRCLQGFARFAYNKPANVKLYLHMGSRPVLAGEVPLVDQLGIRDRILPQQAAATHPHADDTWLNLLYNASDVGINTSQREGWGLISFEHAATGAAQIVPNHSSGAELWPGAALLLDTDEPGPEEESFFVGGHVRVNAVSEALEVLYTNTPTRENLARAGYCFATSDRFQWSNIGGIWRDLLSEVIAS